MKTRFILILLFCAAFAPDGGVNFSIQPPAAAVVPAQVFVPVPTPPNPVVETTRTTIEGAIATLLSALVGFFAYQCYKGKAP